MYTAPFSEIFVAIDPMNVRTNLKFVALPLPRKIGGTPKIWSVPGYAHAPFSPKFLMGFRSDGPFECIGQICSP